MSLTCHLTVAPGPPPGALVLALVLALFPAVLPPASTVSPPGEGTPSAALDGDWPVRFATFNLALNRPQAGDLVAELESESGSDQARQLAEIIQRIRPDVLLLNEIDGDSRGRAVALFQKRYLSRSQNGQSPIEYPWIFVSDSNTGIDSQLDLNQDGRTGTAADAWGYGEFPGQYAMAVLSRYPIQRNQVRTFQKFLWHRMPHANRPVDPASGKPWHSDDLWSALRLSSKSMWDVPLRIGDRTIHLIAAHPTPPVFDGAEDRNGCRNHDEIRMLADYVANRGDYLVDDQGKPGGLAGGAWFVVAGDLNADPFDGDSRRQAARQLTDHPRINPSATPASQGAVEAARDSGGRNREQTGNPAYDTADFPDRSTGNLRVDYCLPCRELEITDCGVYWPRENEPGHELNQASDHHLVWIDVQPRD